MNNKTKLQNTKIFDKKLVAIHKSKTTQHLTNQHMKECVY